MPTKEKKSLLTKDWGSNLQGAVALILLCGGIFWFFGNQEKTLTLHTQQIAMNEQDLKDVREQILQDNSEQDKNLTRVQDNLTNQLSKLNDRVEQIYSMLARPRDTRNG